MPRHHVAIRCSYDSSDQSKVPVGFSWIEALLAKLTYQTQTKQSTPTKQQNAQPKQQNVQNAQPTQVNITKPNYQITMWCVGDCLKYLLNNYETIYGNKNPYEDLLKKLIEAGGKIIVCDMECKQKNISKDDLISSVTLVPLGIDYMITYQEKNRRHVIYDHE